jgi:hypothetical protein
MGLGDKGGEMSPIIKLQLGSFLPKVKAKSSYMLYDTHYAYKPEEI